VARSASELMETAADADNLGDLLFRGLGGILLAIGSAITTGILTLADVVIVPVQALTSALGDLTTAIFGSPAEIVIAGAQATAQSLLGPFNVGPATFALSIASVLAGLYVIQLYLSEEETGNLLPGLPTDVPFIGAEEEDEG